MTKAYAHRKNKYDTHKRRMMRRRSKKPDEISIETESY